MSATDDPGDLRDDWQRFPTDQVSLTMLESACRINPDTGHTELQRFLQMTGGDVTAVIMNGIVYDSVDEALADVDENYGPPILEIEREPGKEPHSEHTVIISLVEEIRRLRRMANWATEAAAYIETFKDDSWEDCGDEDCLDCAENRKLNSLLARLTEIAGTDE